MPKGNIVLVPFPYTDLSGSKLRPALVLTENTLDVTVSFITTASMAGANGRYNTTQK